MAPSHPVPRSAAHTRNEPQILSFGYSELYFRGATRRPSRGISCARPRAVAILTDNDFLWMAYDIQPRYALYCRIEGAFVPLDWKDSSPRLLYRRLPKGQTGPPHPPTPDGAPFCRPEMFKDGRPAS